MSAILSSCGTVRYRLERNIDLLGHVIAFVGVNPSTADAELDDATVRKWCGFSRRLGVRRFLVGNLFAYRATDVGVLASISDPVGPDNDHHLRGILSEADLVVPCWGSRGKLPTPLHGRIDVVRSLVRASGRPVQVFGLTRSGDPKHPLMLGYDTVLREWIP